MFNLADFGGAGTGTVVDNTVFSAAASAVPEGATIIVPKGDYLLNRLILPSSKSLRFVADGKARILDNRAAEGTTTNFLIEWRNGYGASNPVAASGFTNELHELDPSTGTWTTYVTKLTLTNTPTADVVVGALCKVVADDLVTGSATNIARYGQFARIGDVDAANKIVWLDRVLEEVGNYTTSVRLFVLPEKRLDFVGFQWDVANQADTTVTEGTVLVDSAYKPTWQDNVVDFSYDSWLVFQSCVDYLVQGGTIKNCQNNQDYSRDGSGIMDAGSNGGRVIAVSGRNNRHLTTTYSWAASTGDTPNRYGRSLYMDVCDCNAWDHSNSAFNFHRFAMRCRHIANTAYGSYRGSHSNGAGFAYRGKENEGIDNRCFNCYRGVIIFQEEANITSDIRIVNQTVRGATNVALGVEPDSGTNRITGVEIIGGFYEFVGNGASSTRGFFFKSCEATLRGPKFKCAGGVSQWGIQLYSQGSTGAAELNIEKLYFDGSGMGANPRIFELVDANCTVKHTPGATVPLELTMGALAMGSGSVFQGVALAEGTVNLRMIETDAAITKWFKDVSATSGLGFHCAADDSSSAWNTVTNTATGPITSSTDASPIEITTSAAHGRATGDWVFISGHGTNTNANGFFQITLVAGQTTKFTLNGTSGNGLGSGSGGTWTWMDVPGKRTNISSDLSQFWDRALYVKLDPGSSEKRYVIPPLPDGRYKGQMLFLLNGEEQNETNVFGIQHGSTFNTRLPFAQDRNLYPGETQSLVWDGDKWYTASEWMGVRGDTPAITSNNASIPSGRLLQPIDPGSTDPFNVTLPPAAAHVGQVLITRKTAGSGAITVKPTTGDKVNGSATGVVAAHPSTPAVSVRVWLAVDRANWTMIAKAD